jgi:hypothetical protein
MCIYRSSTCKWFITVAGPWTLCILVALAGCCNGYRLKLALHATL